jgi:hypothetical protein
VVAEFAASRPGTQTPDWAGAVATHPELMQSDNLHPTPQGADFRASLIAQGVMGCLSGTLSTAVPSQDREPALESGPEIAGVSRIERRQSALTEAIAVAVARQVLAKMVSTYA